MGSLSTVFDVFAELERRTFARYLKKPDGHSDYYRLEDIVKEYPDMLKIVIYHEGYRVSTASRKAKQQTKALDATHRSARRSKVAVHDIVMSNNWDFWCTFTFNPKKVDRYNYDRVSSKMRMWLNRQKDLRYIIVPEYHKDGAIHFHALIANYRGTLRPTKRKTPNGQQIFRANFGSGFHEFVQLDQNKEAIATYMIKQYITKENIELFGRKRYWTSRGLDRPVSHINAITKYNLWGLVQHRKPDFINGSYEMYTIPKDRPLFSYEEQMRIFSDDLIAKKATTSLLQVKPRRRSGTPSLVPTLRSPEANCH